MIQINRRRFSLIVAAAILIGDSFGQLSFDLEQITQTNIENHIKALEGPRFTQAEKAQTVEYISEQLTSFGYAVTRQAVGSSENISARLVGAERPTKCMWLERISTQSAIPQAQTTMPVAWPGSLRWQVFWRPLA